jgi:hypothetical protein
MAEHGRCQRLASPANVSSSSARRGCLCLIVQFFLQIGETGESNLACLTVDLAAVSYAYDPHAEFLVLNVDDNAIIPDSVFPVIAKSRSGKGCADFRVQRCVRGGT